MFVGDRIPGGSIITVLVTRAAIARSGRRDDGQVPMVVCNQGGGVHALRATTGTPALPLRYRAAASAFPECAVLFASQYIRQTNFVIADLNPSIKDSLKRLRMLLRGSPTSRGSAS